MKVMKKILCLICMMAMTVSMLIPSVSDAKKKAPKLNKNKVTITVGKKAIIKVNNTKKKAKWSVKSGKKNIKLTKKKKKSVAVLAKKKGKATVVAKVGKKTLKCKVTVSAKKDNTKNNGSSNKVTAVKVDSLKVMNPETLQLVLTSAQKLSVVNFTVKTKVYGHGKFNKKLTVVSVNSTDQKTYIIKLDTAGSQISYNEFVQVTITGLQVTGTASVECVYVKEPEECTNETIISVRAKEQMNKNIYSYSYGNSEILSKKLPAGVSCDIIYDSDEEKFKLTGAIAKVGIYTGEIVYKDELNNRYTEKITWVVGDAQTIYAACYNSYGVFKEGENNYATSDLVISGGSGEYKFEFPNEDVYYEWEYDYLSYLEAHIKSAGKQEFEIGIKDYENPEIKTTVIWTVEFIPSQKVAVNVKDASGNTITNNDNVYATFSNLGTDTKFNENSWLVMDEEGKYFVNLVVGNTYDYKFGLLDDSKKVYGYTMTEQTKTLDITIPIYPVTFSMENLDISKAKWYDSYDELVGIGDRLYFSKGSHELVATMLGDTIYNLKANFEYDGKSITVTPTIVS